MVSLHTIVDLLHILSCLVISALPCIPLPYYLPCNNILPEFCCPRHCIASVVSLQSSSIIHVLPHLASYPIPCVLLCLVICHTSKYQRIAGLASLISLVCHKNLKLVCSSTAHVSCLLLLALVLSCLLFGSAGVGSVSSDHLLCHLTLQYLHVC